MLNNRAKLFFIFRVQYYLGTHLEEEAVLVERLKLLIDFLFDRGSYPHILLDYFNQIIMLSYIKF